MATNCGKKVKKVKGVYLRKGKNLDTRGRRESIGEKLRRSQENDSTGGSMARKAVSQRKRDDINDEISKPFTREEWEAKRREEEAIDLERLRRIKREADQHEADIRHRSLRNKQTASVN